MTAHWTVLPWNPNSPAQLRTMSHDNITAPMTLNTQFTLLIMTITWTILGKFLSTHDSNCITLKTMPDVGMEKWWLNVYCNAKHYPSCSLVNANIGCVLLDRYSTIPTSLLDFQESLLIIQHYTSTRCFLHLTGLKLWIYIHRSTHNSSKLEVVKCFNHKGLLNSMCTSPYHCMM